MVKKPTAKDSKPVKEAVVTKKKVVKAKKTEVKRNWAPKWLRAIGGYFVGSWRELRQVRWPNRRASWSLTLAVLIFSAVFMAAIVALDSLFELIIKKVIL